MKNIFTNIFYFFIVLFIASNTSAHSGGTDDNGCHTDSSTGNYHCDHSSTPVSTPTPEPVPVYNCPAEKQCTQMTSCEEAKFHFSNCGNSKLDRDNDGIPCESICGISGTPETENPESSEPNPDTGFKNAIYSGRLRLNDNVCLDVAGPDLHKIGGHVQTWECNDAPNQQWYLDKNNRLINTGGLCLDVAGDDLNVPGGHVQIWECNDAPNQQWHVDENNRLANAGGLCLDVVGDDLNKNGTHVQIWHCNDAPNQQWSWDTRYLQLLSGDGMCLDISGPDLHTIGGHVQIWGCNDAHNQKWKFSNNRLLSAGGLCLDVAGPDLHTLGGHIQIWDCNDTPNQKWYLDDNYRLINGGGLCLNVAGDDLNVQGGHVQIMKCNDALNQIWYPLINTQMSANLSVSNDNCSGLSGAEYNLCQTERMRGNWKLTYQTPYNVIKYYYLVGAIQDHDIPDAYMLVGTNFYGSSEVTYDPNAQLFILVDLTPDNHIKRVFSFSLDNENSLVTGCHFQSIEDMEAGNCHPMQGVRLDS
ncbi:ricin-type beta-trefoil lectin domain protein [Candidatus Venteria ishoeyi]|uniref:Extracellular exo-alpha-L-arabinofuranosidase n=1 Tax=Candidatus Venteria ishoeyi TaxID=1899563 RepID=A0A1H6FAY8_9GAMM|nr:ricin-type beta-trefoil lectin domain protein [Candidatus Venteria ishoeyi]SEH07248.1 Extracellular exo-alpha-L-arabinofuranosidase precursor [Candidatus Venteria ishoeyi]